MNVTKLKIEMLNLDLVQELLFQGIRAEGLKDEFFERVLFFS